MVSYLSFLWILDKGLAEFLTSCPDFRSAISILIFCAKSILNSDMNFKSHVRKNLIMLLKYFILADRGPTMDFFWGDYNNIISNVKKKWGQNDKGHQCKRRAMLKAVVDQDLRKRGKSYGASESLTSSFEERRRLSLERLLILPIPAGFFITGFALTSREDDYRSHQEAHPECHPDELTYDDRVHPEGPGHIVRLQIQA